MYEKKLKKLMQAREDLYTAARSTLNEYSRALKIMHALYAPCDSHTIIVSNLHGTR